MAGESGTPGAGASGRGPGRYQPAVKANDYVVPKSQYFFEHDDRGAGRREPGKRRGAPFESRREEFHPPRRNWTGEPRQEQGEREEPRDLPGQRERGHWEREPPGGRPLQRERGAQPGARSRFLEQTEPAYPREAERGHTHGPARREAPRTRHEAGREWDAGKGGFERPEPRPEWGGRRFPPLRDPAARGSPRERPQLPPRYRSRSRSPSGYGFRDVHANPPTARRSPPAGRGSGSRDRRRSQPDGYRDIPPRDWERPGARPPPLGVGRMCGGRARAPQTPSAAGDKWGHDMFHEINKSPDPEEAKK